MNRHNIVVEAGDALGRRDQLAGALRGHARHEVGDGLLRGTLVPGRKRIAPVLASRGARDAFGNSDGDHQMLQWTAAGSGPRFMGLVHHTDKEREWAYDRTSHIGKLDKALDEAQQRPWTVVDMKTDWRLIYPFEKV